MRACRHRQVAPLSRVAMPATAAGGIKKTQQTKCCKSKMCQRKCTYTKRERERERERESVCVYACTTAQSRDTHARTHARMHARPHTYKHEHAHTQCLGVLDDTGNHGTKSRAHLARIQRTSSKGCRQQPKKGLASISNMLTQKRKTCAHTHEKGVHLNTT